MSQCFVLCQLCEAWGRGAAIPQRIAQAEKPGTAQTSTAAGSNLGCSGPFRRGGVFKNRGSITVDLENGFRRLNGFSLPNPFNPRNPRLT